MIGKNSKLKYNRVFSLNLNMEIVMAYLMSTGHLIHTVIGLCMPNLKNSHIIVKKLQDSSLQLVEVFENLERGFYAVREPTLTV